MIKYLGIEGTSVLTDKISEHDEILDNLEYVRDGDGVNSITTPGSHAGNFSVALGDDCNASTYGLSHGESCTAESHSLSQGKLCEASNYGVALGNNCKADGGLSYGDNCEAVRYSIALGEHCQAKGGAGLSVGYYNIAKGLESIALGAGCVSNGHKCFSTGNNSVACDGDGTISMGYSTSSLNNSVALGSLCKAIGSNSIAIGLNSRTSKVGGVSIGSGSLYVRYIVDSESTATVSSRYERGVVKTSIDPDSQDYIVTVSTKKKFNPEYVHRILLNYTEESYKNLFYYTKSCTENIINSEDGTTIYLYTLVLNKELSPSYYQENALDKFLNSYKIDIYSSEHIANKNNSVSLGYNCVSNTVGGCVVGLNNKAYTGDATDVDRDAFVVGSGKDKDNRENAFRVSFSGNVYANKYNAVGSGYAEYFEWADGNVNSEDRIGYMVALDSTGKIKIANSQDDVIGVVSDFSSIIGNAYEDSWNGKYLQDIYKRFLTEEAQINEFTGEYEGGDEEHLGDPVTLAVEYTVLAENPEYDPNQEYIPRSKRKEWAVIGLFGQLIVKDDGTCVPGLKCTVTDGGIATNGSKWKVIKRVDSNHIAILASFLNSGLSQIPKVTYSLLKSLRDTSKLIPGATYRITDYTCTTVQEETQSAGHVFDILVTADDVNVLNENAHAIQHSGDTYFANSDLSAWELKYCLDNDTTRFAWADDSSAGRGVVYYMKDDLFNECPYDFKNIQFNLLKSFIYYQWGGSYSFIRDTSLDEEISGVTYYGYHCSVVPDAWNSQNCFVTDSQMTKKSTLYSSAGGSPISYGGNIVSVNTEEKHGIYTFSVNNSGIFKDGSLLSSNNIYGNIILNYIKENKLNLNRIWFIGKNIKGNTFGTDCYANTFETDCYNNTFGNDCYSNTFGNDCYSNTFGNTCTNNTFGNYCYYNTFGNNCNYNTFGNGCYRNTFGNGCYRNTFGNYCNDNTFGNDCYSNAFGNTCTNNTFGNYCYYNTLGNGCNGNTFGNDYIYYCTFFDGVQYLNVSITATNTNYLQNMQVLNGTQGTSSSKLQITGDTYVTAGRAYTTTIGMNSSGTLTSKVLMD